MKEYDFKYLRSLIAEASKKRAVFSFSMPDETDAEISYLPSKLRLYWPGNIDCLHFRYEAEKYNAYERSKLRKNTRNYHRIVRKNGRILRIDSYVEGILNIINLMHYEDNRRYSFSYNPVAPGVPAATVVVTYQNGHIVESYTVNHDWQIIHRTYSANNDGTIQYSYINYLPSGNPSVSGTEEGFFTLGEKLSYTQTDAWAWYMEEKTYSAQSSIIPSP